MFEYDEERAVRYIANCLPQELKPKFPDDTLYYILDVIAEFYESFDWLVETDEEQEEQELIRYILRQAAKDNIGRFSESEIRIVLAAETGYSDTLDVEGES
jgi:hypothetical protein